MTEDILDEKEYVFRLFGGDIIRVYFTYYNNVAASWGLDPEEKYFREYMVCADFDKGYERHRIVGIDQGFAIWGFEFSPKSETLESMHRSIAHYAPRDVKVEKVELVKTHNFNFKHLPQYHKITRSDFEVKK